MWKYNYTDELYHHGVKGMKWGVRRERKRRAQDAYRLSERTRLDIEYRDRLSEKRRVQAFKGKSTKKIDAKIKQRNTQIKNQKALYKRLVKDLTKEEISAGEKSVKNILFSGVLSEAIGQARVDKRIRDGY